MILRLEFEFELEFEFHPIIMKNTILLSLPFVLLSACHSDTEQVRKSYEIYLQVRPKYVADSRTALFTATFVEEMNGLTLRGETVFPEAKAKLLAGLQAAGISVADSMELLPYPALAGKIRGIVSVSVCNIRSAPKHSAELGTQALLGTPLRVWKQDGDFYLIQTPDDYFGWVDDGGLALMDEAAFGKWMQSERAVCLADQTYVFAGPDISTEKVSELLAGNILQVLEGQGAFTKIAFPDGRTGFVQSSALLPYPDWLSSRQPTADNILASAREFIGRPYLWGGTSGKGMDCSGFTKTVFYLNGIQLERDASLQVHTGELVETDTTNWANLQPGDLLFFGRHATKEKKERISHVAIYLGDGKIIHASDRVKVESLRRGDPTFAEGRLKSFIRAKRMLGSEGKNGVVALKDSPWYAIK